MVHLAEKTGKVPKQIRDIPVLSQTERQYYQAYMFMSPSKNTGFGQRLIPISEYAAYQQIFTLPVEPETWALVIRAIDIELSKNDRQNSEPEVQRPKPKT